MNDDKLINIYKNADKLIDKIKDKKDFTLIIVGNNGSGKTTVIEAIKKHYNKSNEAYSSYVVNSNRQHTSANPFKSDEYKKSILSHIVSTGESLFEQITDILGSDDKIKILDEPTANMDLVRSSVCIEAFIRSLADIKILSTNDVHSLKVLYNTGLMDVFDVKSGDMIKLKDYINSLVDETIEELKNSPFEMIDYSFYEDLKIKEQ